MFVQKGSISSKEWYSVGHLINSNNDDTYDIVGISGSITGGTKLTIVDGKTGKVLHKFDKKYELGELVSIYCPTKDYVCVAEEDLTMKILSAKDFSLIGTVALSEGIRRTDYADNIFYLDFFDNTQMAINIETAKVVQADFDFLDEIAGFSKSYFHEQTDNNGITYSATEKIGIKEFIVITAVQKNDTLWQTNLRYLNVLLIDDPVILLVDNTIVTYGTQLGDDEYGYIVGLDKKNGMIRYEQKQVSTWSSDLSGFIYNEKYIIAYWGFGLHAYDPNTGERIWNIGGR